MRRILPAILALLVAIGAGVYVAHLAAPPPTVWVPFVATSVPAGTQVTASDIQWRQVIQPPPTAFQGPATPIGLYAMHALVPGEALSQRDVGSAKAAGIKPSDVIWYATLTSAAAEGLATTGNRVEVWAGISATSNTVSAPQLLASGVRVVGLFTATGVPETPGAASSSSGGLVTSTSTTAGGLVALAVPANALPVFLAAQGLQLVVDNAFHHFHAAVPLPKA